MAKVPFTKLKVKPNEEVKTIIFNDNEIEILQYLPVAEKYSLINITLQEAKEGMIYHSVKKDLFFHLNLVFMYTNINFTDKQKEDLLGLYDLLVTSGLMEQILENIPDEEYETLYNYFNEQEQDLLDYNNTLVGTLKNWIESIPENMDKMQSIVKDFDPENFKAVLDFATSANGGRSIN